MCWWAKFKFFKAKIEKLCIEWVYFSWNFRMGQETIPGFSRFGFSFRYFQRDKLRKSNRMNPKCSKFELKINWSKSAAPASIWHLTEAPVVRSWTTLTTSDKSTCSVAYIQAFKEWTHINEWSSLRQPFYNRNGKVPSHFENLIINWTSTSTSFSNFDNFQCTKYIQLDREIMSNEQMLHLEYVHRQVFPFHWWFIFRVCSFDAIISWTMDEYGKFTSYVFCVELLHIRLWSLIDAVLSSSFFVSQHCPMPIWST